MAEIKNPDDGLRRISPGFSLRRVGEQDAEIHFEGEGSDHDFGWYHWQHHELVNLSLLLDEISEQGSRFRAVHNEGFWATLADSRVEFRRSSACTPCLTCDDWETPALLAGLNALLEEQAEEAEAFRHARIAPLLEVTSDDKVSVSREDLLALADIEWAARELFNYRAPEADWIDPGYATARKGLRDAIDRHRR